MNFNEPYDESTMIQNQNRLCGDGLLCGFARIAADPLFDTQYRGLLMEIRSAIAQNRMAIQPASFFTPQEDPVLQNIRFLLERRGMFYAWNRIAFIGCSAGGNAALRALFKDIIVPHIPIVLVMHHRPGFDFMIKFEVRNQVLQRVRKARDRETIQASSLYFIPGDRRLSFPSDSNSFRLTDSQYDGKFRPNIDLVFSEAADCFRDRMVGIILSGILSDGALGAKTVVEKGGEVLIQESASALFTEMPQATRALLPDVAELSLAQIARRINALSAIHLKLYQDPKRAKAW